MKTLRTLLASAGFAAALCLTGCGSYASNSGIYTSVNGPAARPEIDRLELHVANDGSFTGSMVMLQYNSMAALLGAKRVDTESLAVHGTIDKGQLRMVISGLGEQAAEGRIDAHTIEISVPMKETLTRSTQAEYQAMVKKVFGKNAPNV